MIKFGADPEVFAFYIKDGKEYVISPALLEKDCGIKSLGGTVKHPLYILDKTFSWMMDGVAFELTLLQPQNSFLEVWKVIQNGLDALHEFLSKLTHPEFGKIGLSIKPTINIDPEIYLPYLHLENIHQGFIFGCDRDYDADDLNYKSPEIDVSKYLFRHGGGHEHFSGVKEFENYIRPAVRLSAITLGTFSTLETLYPELELLRIGTYGRPERYRPQKYGGIIPGMEYRTPSNSWITFPPEKIEEMDYLARKMIFYLQHPEIGIPVKREYLQPACEAIINVDKELAKNILSNLP